MKTATLAKCALVILLLTCVPQPSVAQPAFVSYARKPHPLDSGRHDGTGKRDTVKLREVIEVTEAPWMRLHFGEYDLGSGSYITITSRKDGEWQRLDARSMPQWRSSSAFFNGDAVEIELHVAPDDRQVYFHIKEISAGQSKGARPPSTEPPDGPGSRSICGDDHRVLSNDVRVGRITDDDPVNTRFAFCTGWIVSNGAHLTAGHCNDPAGGYDMQILEFDVPSSNCAGHVAFADPNDQYPIDATSIQSFDDGDSPIGNDWAVFACFPNANTGRLPVEDRRDFFRMTRDISNSSTVRVTGYGTDSDPAGCGGGPCTPDTCNADSQTLQTDAGSFLGETIEGPSDVLIEYIVDSEGGNSGGPVIDSGTGLAIGIHTNAGCDPPDEGNSGTGFEHDNLENAIRTFPGQNVIYADVGHPLGVEDGTVFRPYEKIAHAVVAVPTSGIVSIVRGSYDETLIIDKTVTLEAPVGTVIIGQ